jgi:ParB family chromosome partitioning protein
MTKKMALGRGLGALIDDADMEKIKSVGSINEIDLSLIDLNPFQPRTSIDEESLNELASSIKQLGIIQPVTVRQQPNNRYQLITGERRYKAAIIAGLQTIPAYLRTADDQNLLELALVENIQREDLDSIEVAISYKRLIEECNLTQESMSERVGKKRSTIANYLRLLKLPAEIQLGLKQKKLSMGHARALVNIEDPHIQIDIYYKIIEEDLSVRQVEELVRKSQEKGEDKNLKKERKEKIHQDFTQLEEHLSHFFGTGIQFRLNEKGKGKIVIPFESTDELERIISIFDRLQL